MTKEAYFGIFGRKTWPEGYEKMLKIPDDEKALKGEKEYWVKFLVINDTTILHNPEIQPFINKKVGEYKNIRIYDLQEIQTQQ